MSICQSDKDKSSLFNQWDDRFRLFVNEDSLSSWKEIVTNEKVDDGRKRNSINEYLNF